MTGGENLGALEREARESAASAASPQALRELRARYLGRKSPVTALLRGIGELEPAERARMGQLVQAAQQRLEALFDARKLELEREDQARALAGRRLDVSLPGAVAPRGALHPVTSIEREMTAFFTSMGFSVEDGPEVETEWHNFDALNTPADHPARDQHDTFFVEGGRVLRTHTSTVQIRVMTGRQPPFRFITLGRVYRHDYDATHAPMFHQIDGFIVDERVTMADLKGVLYAFARHLMGPDVQLRFRAHFFPFTEPSAEIDFSWNGGWLEWGGCGMIHPRVLENCGIDSARWQGFAFGMGIDRTAMLRFGVPNIHVLFEGDVRALEQFPVKLPLRWLAEYVDLPGSTDALAERLTLAGLEIEGTLRTGPDLSQVVVGHVLERAPHPDADRLSVCRVDLGEGEPLTIVCGAPNVRAGLRVAVARPGTTLPDGTKLKKAKIRGVASEGMICSARELGLGGEHAGILELAADARVGARLPEVIATGDTVLDLEITPNRGDWASILGMAREVRAHFGGPLRLPPCDPVEAERSAAQDVRVAIDDAEGCHAYCARVVRGVRIGPSPAWLVERLESAGLRSINNAVDVTNLVMLELGQPLHAFDLASLRGGEIRVRRARAGEKLAFLDGQVRGLEPEDLVIADAERAIALAGVMGGAETEVRAETRDLAIESAHFDPRRVRRSARRLGLRTDASYRFERGIDSAGVARAADRCARLIAELCGGSVSRGRVEQRGNVFAHCGEIRLDPAHPTRLLGVPLERDAVTACLARLEIASTPEPDGRLRCTIPSWRNDLSIPQDLVEEVARVYGYDRLPATVPQGTLSPVALPRPRALAARARDSLCALGLLETRSIPLLAPEDIDALRLAVDDPRRRSVRVLNPIIEADPDLRTSLLPGLLRAARRNRARQVERVRLFELGRSFQANAPGEAPDEPEGLAAVLLGSERSSIWEAGGVPVFFEAKGITERLLAELGLAARFRAGSDAPYLHPGACGELRAGKRIVARVGELHPETAARYELGTGCAVLEVDLETLAGLDPVLPRYSDVSPYPAARRDLAVLVALEQPAGEVLDAIRSAAGPLLTGVVLFDRYEGKGVPPGKLSLAFRLEFQRSDRTLTEAEVASAVERVVRMLGERFGGELRQGA